MTRVAAVDNTMIPEVVRFLRRVDPVVDPTTWQLLFEPPWRPPAPQRGWALLDDEDAVVGVLGALFVDRTLRGRPRHLCNLTSYFVDDAHRGSALSLLRPLAELRDHTIIDLSPSDTVVRLSRRLGFIDLDTSWRVLTRPSLRRHPALSKAARVEVSVDDARAAQRLPADARRLFDDHAGLPSCRRVIVEDGTGSCLILLRTAAELVEDDFVPYGHLLHVSDPDVVVRAYPSLWPVLQRLAPSRTVVADGRFPFTRELPGYASPDRRAALFRPADDDLRPEDIDAAYSELTLLGFSQLKMQRSPRERWLRSQARRTLDLRHRTRSEVSP